MPATTYRVTPAGRAAWESKDLAVPSDYRTILWVMDFRGAKHLQSLIQLYPGQLIEECLAEMDELDLVERAPAADGSAPAPAMLARPAASVLSIAQTELPQAADALARHGAYLSAERIGSRRPSGKPPGETTVLIVEDDPDQLALADLRVSMAGYAVRVAPSQAAMLKTLADNGRPDLLLLDAVLPDGDGFTIVRDFRQFEVFAAMPIVLLTARAAPADIVEGLRLGADGYITKPYSKSILASVVARVLGR